MTGPPQDREPPPAFADPPAEVVRRAGASADGPAEPGLSMECEHLHNEIRRRPLQNGSVHFIGQCLDCGRTVGTARRHETIPNKSAIPLFDEELIHAKWRTLAQAREIENKKWWTWYSNYLNTWAWAQKRAAVFQREEGVCQGCRRNQATQAHHLTYEHVGNELLFELIALCAKCHETAHSDQSPAFTPALAQSRATQLQD